MYKALLKKQMLEFAAMWIKDKKTGKMRTGGSLVGFIVLFVFIFATLGFAFVSIAMALAEAFLPVGLDWLYFAMMGMIALLLGVFGDVFNSFASLYLAKDNELLLSLPVTPSAILSVRMVSVYLMGFIYEGIVFLPAVIVYWIKAELNFTKVLFPLLLLFLVGVIVVVLTCILGYGVAQISKRIKGKAFVTVLASLVFLTAYYVFYFRLNIFLQTVAMDPGVIGDKVKGYAYPLYVFGLAGAGDVKSMLIFIAIAAAVFALTYLVLSKTFIGIATDTGAGKKAALKEKDLLSKSSGVSAALLKRELKHLTSSATYMMNCGLGLVIMLAASVAAVVKADYLRELLSMLFAEMPAFSSLTSCAAALVLCMILAMNQFTAPSVSLEGKNLWILQSLPVAAADVLRAKERMHVLLNLLPALVSLALLCVVLKINIVEACVCAAFLAAFILFSADLGLLLDLAKPNLVWTNENVPVKQNMSVLFSMLAGFGVNVLFAVACWFGSAVMPPAVICLLFAVLLFAASFFMRKNILTRGAEKFVWL